jgi:hypothetical protein
MALILSSTIGSIVWAISPSIKGPLITPNDPEQSTTMPQRIAQRKTLYKTNLTATQKQSIVSRCTVAQSALQNIKTKDTANFNNRRDTYTDLAVQLNTIIDHLERQGIDTNSLKIAQKLFNNSINQYLADYVSYKTAMNDVVVMECKADPLGFESTLLNARVFRSKLSADSSFIKSNSISVIKSLSGTKNLLIKASKANQ